MMNWKEGIVDYLVSEVAGEHIFLEELSPEPTKKEKSKEENG